MRARSLAWSVLLSVVGCSDPDRGVAPDAAGGAPDAAPAADGAPDASVTGDDACFATARVDGHHAIDCDGIRYDVEVPPGCAAGGCGVILDVHGLTMSAAMQDANTELRARGGAAGFVVIQPSANPAPPQSSWSTSDDALVHDFLTRAIAAYAIDPDRVHMTGFSQGGFMTWRMLCAHAELFASVAPAAAASDCPAAGLGPVQEACRFEDGELPARELPVLYLHGTAEENYVPWACAEPQVEAIAAAWDLAPAGVVESGAGYVRSRWSDATGTVVELLAHDYASSAQVPFVSSSELQGHCFPGSDDPGDQPGQLFSFRCEGSSAFTWGVEVVEFFLAHPRS